LYSDNYTIDGSTFHVFLLTIQSHTKYCIQADNVEKISVKILKKAKNIEKCGIIFYANIR